MRRTGRIRTHPQGPQEVDPGIISRVTSEENQGAALLGQMLQKQNSLLPTLRPRAIPPHESKRDRKT